MGGNVVVADTSGKLQRAGRADFRKLSRQQFIAAFTALFKRLDSMYESHAGESLWPPGKVAGLLASGAAFSGSSSHLFNKNLSDEEFTEHKPVVGDIDITVPREKLEGFYEMLNSVHGAKITPQITFVGQKQSTSHDQANALFAYAFSEDEPPVNVQVDFEAVDYETDKPADFFKFSRSSDWSDIKGGIKGVFHKLLLRSLSTVLTTQEDVVLLTPASPLFPPEKIKVSKVEDPVHLVSFSVDKGVRTTARQQFLPDGSPVLVGGKRAFKKVGTAESTYYQTRGDIFTLIFGTGPVGNELSLLGSYAGILQLLQDHLTNDQVEKVYLDFLDKKLFGRTAQALDAYDPNVDMGAKMPALNAFRDKFSFLRAHDDLVDRLMDDYYKNYKIRVIESARSRWRNFIFESGKNDFLEKIPYEEFDDLDTGVWRKLAEQQREEEAIDYMKKYLSSNKSDLEDYQIGAILWHIGQLYAFVEDYKNAVKYMSMGKVSSSIEPNYQMGTISFLKRDLESLKKFHKKLVKHDPAGGSGRDMLSNFIDNFDKNYKQVY